MTKVFQHFQQSLKVTFYWWALKKRETVGLEKNQLQVIAEVTQTSNKLVVLHTNYICGLGKNYQNDP